MEHFDHDHHEHMDCPQHAHEHIEGHEHAHGEHTHTHTHEHTHDGVTHTHEHTHAHVHTAEGATPEEQTIAVLRYMLDHNIHHAAELNDLSQQFSGEVHHQLIHAVEAFDQANGYLAAALDLLP